MKTLHLVLKHKWFDLISSGEKPEEYREKTGYWERRIWKNRFNIDKVVFHRGYTDTTTTRKVKEIVSGFGKQEWGAEPGIEYYVLKLEH